MLTKSSSGFRNLPLSKSLSLGEALHSQTVAVGTGDTGSIDMQKFRRAMFLLDVGAFGTNATVDMKLQESSDNSSFTDVAGIGTSITQLVAAGGDNRQASIEVHVSRLTKRYVRARVTVGTGNTALSCVPMGGDPVTTPASAYDSFSVTERQQVT